MTVPQPTEAHWRLAGPERPDAGRADPFGIGRAHALGSANLPVRDGGATLAQVDAQQAALEQAQLAYVAAVLLALKDVEDALVAQRDDRLRLVLQTSAAHAAANAAQLASQRYSSGLVDFQTVLGTQRTAAAIARAQPLVAGRAQRQSAHHLEQCRRRAEQFDCPTTQADQRDNGQVAHALHRTTHCRAQ